jgi:HlyD family type I secretion membrane fusion protein
MAAATGATAVREWYAGVPRRTHVPTTAGVAAIVVFLLGFGYWSNTALIAGAVITSGAFVTTGQNKIIQHLEGGVIRDILVHEGDGVEIGQTLIELDPTAPKAELDRLVHRHLRSEAMEARLVAEIRDESQVTFPPELLARHEPDIQSMVGTQQLTFDAWRKNLDSDIAALKDSINAIEERISAAHTQKRAVERQVDLIGEELKSKSSLLPEGLVRKPEILALQRA